MAEEQTWTDEELAAHLTAWNKMLSECDTPRITLRTARTMLEPRYELLLHDERVIVVLPPAQAKRVSGWLGSMMMQPKQPVKHDGYLGEGGRYRVYYGLGRDQKTRFIAIEGGFSRYGDDVVEMPPAQALSLLAWLKQEEAELQRMAKEQEP